VRRAVVLDAAVVRFAEVGRDRATIDEISAASGVRKPSIFELFGSKAELYRAAVEHEEQALIDFARAANVETAHLPLAERMRWRIDAALARAEARPHGFQLLERARSEPPERTLSDGVAAANPVIAVMADNYRREAQAAGTPIDASAELLARLFFALANQVVAMRLADPSWDRDALVDFLASFIAGGMDAVEPSTWQALEAKGDAVDR
jgi:AcrR family transcriptional regulator